MSAVQGILLCDNAQHATEHILHHSDSAFVQSLPKSTVGIHSIPTTLELDKASEWSIGPPAEWLTAPLVSLPSWDKPSSAMLCPPFEKVLQQLFKLHTILIRGPARSMLVSTMVT